MAPASFPAPRVRTTLHSPLPTSAPRSSPRWCPPAISHIQLVLCLDVVNSGGGSSNQLDFSVVALDPYINDLAPTSMIAKTAPTAIVINGSNFMSGAKVLWNGKPTPTTYLSSSQLQVTPSAAQVAAAGIVQLTVSNPPPGGVSAEVNFNVTYPAKVTVLDLPANNLVWDPYAHASTPPCPAATAHKATPSPTSIPPPAESPDTYFAGSEPNQLAISADSQYLYVG